MSAADGRYTLVFNGEIFNYSVLRGELEGFGESFRSRSDTEVLLRAFVRWGPECVERLRGFFAFAVFDRDQNALFLARDRLGIKPLYFAHTRCGFAFSSEVRALLPLLSERRLDTEALQGYLAFGSYAEPGTAVRGIRLLPAGTWLLHTRAGEREERYWEVPVARDPAFRHEPSAVEGLRTEIREAVRLRLVSDVPLGIFLSGGLDSSVVVAMAAETAGRALRTFTIGFEEAVYDESRHAALVAKTFGCEHVPVGLSAERAAAEIDEAVAALDQPSADGINTYFVSKATRAAGITVALSGLGGDELFAGYHHFRNFQRAIALRPALRALGWFPGEAALPRSVALSTRQHVLKALALVSSGGGVAGIYRNLRAMFTPGQVHHLLDGGVNSARDLVHIPHGLGVEKAARDPVTAFAALELANYLRNTLLRDTDVMSMAHALEVRVPLVDHKVVEMAMATPGAFKMTGTTNKPLLAATVPTLPSSTIHRQKMGFTLPFDTWFRGRLRPWMEERLLGAPIRSVGVIDAEAVSRLWRSYLRGEENVSHARVWCLATLADWCWRHRVSA
jgi:asparagine synthase (glutamine-hydrolysing)